MKNKKFYGQHFLKDKAYLRRIVEAAKIEKDDTVFEIGPGDGALTRLLVERAKRVVAVEIDKDAVNALKQNVVSDALDIYCDDIQNISDKRMRSWTRGPFILVANIPYNITAEIIKKFITRTAPENTIPSRAVLLVQKEVADRIVAGAGNMNMLALAVRLYGEPKKLIEVPAGAFYPPPKVDSAVLSWRRFATSELKQRGAEDPERVLSFANAAFLAKRKQIQNTLGGKFGKERVKNALEELKKSDKARPEELSVDDWLALFHRLAG
ncbi:MAG: 16S rRNA (adenine(1518)-N(6)/adenine(1519)-N(6))-dimethyltransferase RsmA [Patescibacteria group bacterium]